MKKILILILPLFLTACISQSQADVKMAKGCESGVNAILTDNNRQIQEIKVTRYADEDFDGGKHRRITFEAIEKDGWLELDKEYSCLFMQQWGIFNSSHRAMLVQVKMDEEIIGKDSDGKIQGELQNFLNLTNSVSATMGQ